MNENKYINGSMPIEEVHPTAAAWMQKLKPLGLLQRYFSGHGFLTITGLGRFGDECRYRIDPDEREWFLRPIGDIELECEGYTDALKAMLAAGCEMLGDSGLGLSPVVDCCDGIIYIPGDSWAEVPEYPSIVTLISDEGAPYYLARSLGFPNCTADGKTVEEAEKALAEVISDFIDHYREHSIPLPGEEATEQPIEPEEKSNKEAAESINIVSELKAWMHPIQFYVFDKIDGEFEFVKLCDLWGLRDKIATLTKERDEAFHAFELERNTSSNLRSERARAKDSFEMSRTEWRKQRDKHKEAEHRSDVEYGGLMGRFNQLLSIISEDGSLETFDEVLSIAQDAMAALNGVSAMAEEIVQLKAPLPKRLLESEYIEGDEITLEIALMQLPCETETETMGKWHNNTLAYLDKHDTWPFKCTDGDSYCRCRIKRSALKGGE